MILSELYPTTAVEVARRRCQLAAASWAKARREGDPTINWQHQYLRGIQGVIFSMRLWNVGDNK